MIYAFLWPNFTSASAYCYLDWFEIPLQFHELHKPNPVPNCALSRHLSQTRNQALVSPTNQSLPFLSPSSNSSSNAVVSFSSFRLGNNNLHLMGISPTERWMNSSPISDPRDPSFKSSRAKRPTGLHPAAVDLDPFHSTAIWRWILRCCIPFNNLGMMLIQFDLRSSHVLSWWKRRKGAQLHTCARKEWKTSNFAAGFLRSYGASMYVCNWILYEYVYIYT